MSAAAGSTTGREPYQLRLAAGEYIFREGELGTEMFIISEGKVEILQRVKDEDRSLAILEKGDFFGEMALLDDLPRAASARAATEVRLLRINGSTFANMLRDNAEVAVRMLRKLSRRLRETDRMLKEALGNPEAAGAPEIPTPDREPAETATAETGPERLLHEPSGMEFPLSSSSESTVGRRDPVTGIYPDIDLTPVDSQRSVSRRHAKIYRRGGKFFLTEEIGTMNGTFRNGTRLETGVPGEIRANDLARFGLVTLRFVTE